ncbi:MAG TPA: hypothetical protein VEI46_05875 [Thermodesulfovibrionales bacterium]|nr:hypothetical protein [Thermodesulfovibrionales bacterium]
MINAYGGKESIESIQSMHIKGEIEAFMLHDYGTYELYFKRGKKLRVETKYEHSSEIRILNGERGYRGTGVLPLEEVFGARYFAMAYQFRHLDILHDLVKGTYQIQTMGKSSVSGSDVEVFHLNDKNGAIMDIYIDEHTFLILKVTGYFKEKGKELDLSVEFSDFKKVGASVFPFRITNYAGGLKIAQTVIDNYLLNPDITDSLFEPTIIRSL